MPVGAKPRLGASVSSATAPSISVPSKPLTLAERKLLAKLRKERAKRDASIWWPHAPFPKQQAFLSLECEEALYGGAAGGGKSDALLMCASQYVHVPGYAALVLRRTFPELYGQDAILERAKRWWLPKGVPWSEKEKKFTFPSGATVAFGYLDTDRDKYQYQSRAYDCIVFDELTEFPEASYTFLFSRLRRLAGSKVPSRMRAGTNPGGVGHEWVKARFGLDEDGQQTQQAALDVAFVQALLDDNPYIDKDEYRKKLARLDPLTRQQLEFGKWISGGKGFVYGDFASKRNVIAEHPVDLVRRLKLDSFILGLDFGTTSPNAFSVVGWAKGSKQVFVLESYKRPGALAENIVSDEIRPLRSRYPFVHIAGDIGGLGKQLQLEMTRRFAIPIEAAEKANKLGYVRLYNGALSRGDVVLCADTCKPLIDEYHSLPWDETGQHEAKGYANHCADATLYAWRACFAYLEVAESPKPKPGTREHLEAQAAEWERMACETEEQDPWERAGF